MGLVFDGLLGLHIIFALLWIVASFILVRSLMGLIRSPNDTHIKQRALVAQRVVAAAGGMTVLVGATFYYYINFYRTAYATSSAGLPLVDAGALLGIIVFVWQMATGPRVRRSLNALGASPNVSPNVTVATVPARTTDTSLPKSWIVLLPAILLLLAFALMIGGSMM